MNPIISAEFNNSDVDSSIKLINDESSKNTGNQQEQIFVTSSDPNLLVDEISLIDLSQDAFHEKDQSPKKLQNTQRADQRQNYRSTRSVRSINRRHQQPQPHVCILDKTVDGRNVFINVLSWSKILKPEHPLHPIPLYGGNRVLTSNPKMAEELIYAVTANPEVLEKTRRTGGNSQAQQALMCLMTEFVEEMNPGLKLMKQPIIIENRDLTGELKDIWLTIQAKRERDKISAMEHTPGMIYEEFGPDSAPKQISPSQFQTQLIEPNNENKTENVVNLDKKVDETDSKNELLPLWPSIPPDIINSQTDVTPKENEVNIDFSINPYLVPYPELNCLVNIVMDQTTDKVQEAKLEDKIETDNDLKFDIVENGKETTNSNDIPEESIIEQQTQQNLKDGTEKQQQQQQHQLESFKKSIEFLTNGCHNFFLFKSKNQQQDGNNLKKSKEKGKKIKNKNDEMVKKSEQCNNMIRVTRQEENGEDIAIKT